ncbi:MAG: trypsin-like peptidase domain-containing protein [Planctomycetes bacterium]|nr:trypsin-like peptidase domain-containing protein [Planctomycetota bacterium]
MGSRTRFARQALGALAGVAAVLVAEVVVLHWKLEVQAIRLEDHARDLAAQREAMVRVDRDGACAAARAEQEGRWVRTALREMGLAVARNEALRRRDADGLTRAVERVGRAEEGVETLLRSSARGEAALGSSLRDLARQADAAREDALREVERLTRRIDQVAAAANEAEGRLLASEATLELARRYLAEDDGALERALIRPSVQVTSGRDVGSGTIIYSRDGHTYILTAFHVVAGERETPSEAASLAGEDVGSGGAPRCTVRVYDGETLGGSSFEAEMVRGSRDLDVALLILDSDRDFPDVARLAPRDSGDGVGVFTRVYAVGCPLGYAPLPSMGEVSSKTKELRGRNYWMINAPTIFGNSGGGIFLAETRELIGVLSRVSAYNNFINIAVPHMGILVPIEPICEWLDKEGFAFLGQAGGDGAPVQGPEPATGVPAAGVPVAPSYATSCGQGPPPAPR